MSEDTIKRSDAIKATWQEPTYTDPLNVLTEVRDRIEAIPSADRPQGEWIPCSERLPKPYVEVLVCDDFGWINLGAYRPCDVSEDCSGWSIHAHTKIGTEEVIAWMPLPKPWEGADYE